MAYMASSYPELLMMWWGGWAGHSVDTYVLCSSSKTLVYVWKCKKTNKIYLIPIYLIGCWKDEGPLTKAFPREPHRILYSLNCTTRFMKTFLWGSAIVGPSWGFLFVGSLNASFTSLVPSDTEKENWSACFSSSLVWTYWMLRDTRSAWVKVLILVPGERGGGIDHN